MTNSTSNDRFDELDRRFEVLIETLEQQAKRFDEKLDQQTKRFDEKLDRAIIERQQFDERFENYQRSTQWVVQLAFTLIASATLTVIVTAVLKQ